MLPGDFQPVEVPEAEDAVRAYQRAEGYVTSGAGPRAFRWDFDGTLPLTDADRRGLANLLTSNAKAFQLARAARPLSRYGTAGFRSPVAATPGPSPNSRLLAQMLLWRSLYDHDAGDDDEAIESVRDVLRLSLAVEHEAPDRRARRRRRRHRPVRHDHPLADHARSSRRNQLGTIGSRPGTRGPAGGQAGYTNPGQGADRGAAGRPGDPRSAYPQRLERADDCA